MRYRPTPPLMLLRRLALSIERNGVRGAAIRPAQRLLRSLRNHGLRGTFERKAPAAPVDTADTWTVVVHSFDLEHGTDTAPVLAVELDMIALSGLYSSGHLGIPPPALTEAISRLPIAHEAFTFVDIGCGKGRALMVASAFPFRRLVGVEISPELCEIARANTARRPEWSDRISVINQDAVRFIFPDGPLLIFLYYPFLVGTIFRRVLSSLERQLRRAPREAYLLCVENPYEYEKVLQQFSFLRQIAESTHDLSPEDYIFRTDSKRTRLEVTKRDPSHDARFTLYRADTCA
jgi:SAM-dependent methyltransferase